MEIIPGPPNDLGRECLLRVPLTSHTKLPSVSTSWENIVTNPHFYKNRKKYGASQELIILVSGLHIKIYDPIEKSLENLPPIPLALPYIGWTFLRIRYSAFADGKLYVVQGYTNWPSVACYDPNKQQWLYIAKFPYDLSFHYHVNSPPLPAFGRLFFAADGRVIEYDFVEKRFRAVGKHYSHLSESLGMTLWKGQIVMYGRGYKRCKLYLFEPGDEGTEGKWTLLDSWPGDYMTL